MKHLELRAELKILGRFLICHDAPEPPFQAVEFSLPALETDADPASLLARLDRKPWSGTLEEAERELRRRLDEHAATLPYPAAVLVSEDRSGVQESPLDLLTTCAILAKSCGHVYLRDKEPNLANIRQGRIVVLHIPNQDKYQC
jgi:hypothetical protein